MQLSADGSWHHRRSVEQPTVLTSTNLFANTSSHNIHWGGLLGQRRDSALEERENC
jgi:hypothetical protein